MGCCSIALCLTRAIAGRERWEALVPFFDQQVQKLATAQLALDVNVSEGSCYENITPLDIGSGQGPGNYIARYCQFTEISPVEILVASHRVRSVHVNFHNY